MNPKSFNFESMGTFWEISIWDDINEKKINELKKKIIEQAKEFENTYSRFKQDSFVSNISRKTGEITVPQDFVEMLSIYINLYELTDKKLNPLIAATLNDLGYDANYTLRPKKYISKVPDLTNSVSIKNEKTIVVNKPSLFDFGALGKGYFVDMVALLLKKNKIKRFLVNGSGDIYYEGDEAIRAGLEHPEDNSKVIGVVEMRNGAMCASASNRRKWNKYHHIVDAVSLKSTDEIIATWVMAQEAAVSDALATALFLTNPENFAKDFEFEYLILNKEYKVKRSKGFTAELF